MPQSTESKLMLFYLRSEKHSFSLALLLIILRISIVNFPQLEEIGEQVTTMANVYYSNAFNYDINSIDSC